MKLRVENREKTLEFPPTQRDWERIEISFYPPHMWNEFLFLSFLFSPPDVTQTEKNDLVKGETQTTCQDRLERERMNCVPFSPFPIHPGRIWWQLTVKPKPSDIKEKLLGIEASSLSLHKCPSICFDSFQIDDHWKSWVQNSSLCGRRRKPKM